MLLKKILSIFFLLFIIVAIAQPPTDEQLQMAREHFNKGVKHGIDHNYDQAIKEFNIATDLNPLFAEAFLYRGLARIELTDYHLAIKDLSMSIEIDPKFSDQAHYFRGLAKYNIEDFNGSIDDLSIAIRMNPDFVAFFQRGKANLKLKEYRRSLQDFEIAIRLQPEFHEAYLYRGISHYYMDKLDEALEDLEIAKKYLPDNAMAFYYSGLARTGIRNSYVAIEDLNRAIELDPSFASAYKARAAAQINTGNKALAKLDKERAQAIQSGDSLGTREKVYSQGLSGPAHAAGGEILLPTSATDINFAKLFSVQTRNEGQSDMSEIANELVDPGNNPQILVEATSPVKPFTSNFTISDAPNGTYSVLMEKIIPEGFGVQVASYSNTNNLVKLAKAYEESYNVPVVISVATVNNRKIYRLILGQYSNRHAAEQFRDKLRNDGFPDAFLVLFENL